jgi:hypothetical protein
MNKAYLLLFILPFASFNTAAQGTIIFSNADIPNFAGNGVYNAHVVYTGLSTPGGSDLTAGLFSGETMLTSTPIVGNTGLFLGDEVAVPGSAAGSRPTLQVRVWLTTAGSYVNAESQNVVHSHRFDGIFQTAPLGGPNPTPPPPAIFTPSLTGFGNESSQIGIILITPEPSTYALALLGLIALSTQGGKNREKS